jgi:ABC-type branched-subunit amino acid transport system ATPase component/ABC-type branched-subunit amino acid transport system permease subunit
MIRAGLLLSLLVVSALMPALIGGSALQLGKLNYILSGMMLAVGLNIVLGFAGQLFLGPAAVFGICAYVAAYLADQKTFLQPLPVMVLVALVVAVVVSLIIAIPSLRIGQFYLGMITLVLASLIPIVADQVSVVGGAGGISLIANQSFTQSPAGYPLYCVGLGFVVVLVLLSWLIKSSQLGREFETVKQSEQLAASLGIRPYRVKLLAFMLAAPCAALSASFYIYSQQFISPGSLPTNLSIYLLAGVVIGGTGRIVGPVIGVALIFAASEFLGGFSQYEGIAFGGLLVLTAIAQVKGSAVVHNMLPRLARSPSVGRWVPSSAAVAGAEARPRTDGEPLAMSPGLPETVLAPRVAARLDIRDVSRAFGGVRAVSGVTLAVSAGTVHALVGPNGSGKTTVLNLVSRLYRPDAGEIVLGDVRIDAQSPASIARLGVKRTFQTPKLLVESSVYDNVLIAAEVAAGGKGVNSMLRLPGSQSALAKAKARTDDALAMVGLDRPFAQAGKLSHGTQRLIEVARAVAARARFVLLDEPAAGLSDVEIRQLKTVVRRLADAGIGVLIVEHNTQLVLDLADEITVLDEGTVVTSGDPREVMEDPLVATIYLGGQSGRAAVSAGKSRGCTKDRPALLDVSGLRAGYGSVGVVNDVSLAVNGAEIVALVGRNGVGKTTALAAIAGVRFGANSGTVTYRGSDIGKVSAPEISAAGIALVPEGRRIFRDMTVLENLQIGSYVYRRARDGEWRQRLEHVLTVFPMLRDFLGALAGQLSGGQQQMVAVGQALMSSPGVLLLDEPSAGLAPIVIDHLYGAIGLLRDEGLGILLVEQDLERALRVSDRYYLMESGAIILQGESVDADRDLLKRLILSETPKGQQLPGLSGPQPRPSMARERP